MSTRLDLLFLNAGVAGIAPSLTEDGFEAHFGINHVGHTLLTQLLMPTLLATQKLPDSDVRVLVTTGIGAHKLAPKKGLQLDLMKTTAESMSPMARSGHSKLANILFARKLAQVYPEITTTSHHPGTVKSEIWQKADGVSMILNLIAKLVVWLTAVSVEKGARSGLWTAVAEKSSIKNGEYYEPVGINKYRTQNATSQKLTDELWDWTNKELAEHDGPGWPEK
ncbi:related to alcohol dehydrogenase homolog Bli-4 [Ramularia collo-cygni]|uniref:Related to alcohol dehydrogenase homolog Bli-4 n=1 Tax=Ramularia collo-cygni TaxID=112498 RepID=A0A2D3UTX5_9PEZI|nr:related to alcohol dehydrogenase homolog Bli-4 [Ramularia collo-cygni]CZT19961.1 related to alcohol dehydrogenase homolog Bli-4 [Ramularia collo-cygni]